jgi:hypothetical protein
MNSKELRKVRCVPVSSAGFLMCVLLSSTVYWTAPAAALGQEEHSKSSVAKPTPDLCGKLLSSSEIEKVQGESVVDTKYSQQPGGSFLLHACFYRTVSFTKSISLALALPNPAGKGHEGPREYWSRHFHDAGAPDGQLADGRKPETEKEEEAEGGIKPVKVTGLGEEAYWIPNPHIGTLYVLQEDSFLRISLGGKDDNDVRSNKAKDLARIALKRLKSARAGNGKDVKGHPENKDVTLRLRSLED